MALKLTHLIALFGVIVLLSACQETDQLPLPTIIPAKDIPTSKPTIDAAVLDTVTPLPTEIEMPAATPVPDNKADTSTPPLTTEPTETPTDTPLPSPTPIPPPVVIPSLPTLADISLTFTPLADGFEQPTFLTHAGDGTEWLYVVEQAGRILILKDGAVNVTPFLDIVDIVGSDANEQGLLSIAFHPNYSNNGYLFVNYTNNQGDTVIARYQKSDDPNMVAPTSAKILMTIDQPYANHNGGQIAFGPDGYLYIGMGDGGAGGDPQNRAQDLNTVLGKILRIDVDQGKPYGVPQTNPFVAKVQSRPEIWSYGWRNPWRFSFDTATNDMYIADVGQNQHEEVHVEWADTPGQNYGWRLMEGFHCFKPAECTPSELDLALPITEYDHNFGCSITGGYVYRGNQYPTLEGVYLYGDYCSGIVWGLQYDPNGEWQEIELTKSDKAISSFGQDEAGELYLVDHKGTIFHIGY